MNAFGVCQALSWLAKEKRDLQEHFERESEIEPLIHRLIAEKVILAALPGLSVHILEQVREHGRIKIGEMVTLTGVSRNTLKAHFRQLQEKGHLVLHGSGRDAWYSIQ